MVYRAAEQERGDCYQGMSNRVKSTHGSGGLEDEIIHEVKSSMDGSDIQIERKVVVDGVVH